MAHMHGRAGRGLWLAATMAAWPLAAWSQANSPQGPVVPGVAAPVAHALPAPAPDSVPPTEKLAEGTTVRLQLDERLSSETSAEGDEFGVTTYEPIQLPDGRVIPAGYKGRGEVTTAHKKGMLGKPGDLTIRVDYIKIGDTKVHVRASKGGEGHDTVGTTVALSLIVSPLFLMHHGHEVVMPKGQVIHAEIDEDAVVATPAQPAAPMATPPPAH